MASRRIVQRQRCPHCRQALTGWTREMCLNAGFRWVEENDRPPKQREWSGTKHGLPDYAPSHIVIERIFGSWGAFVEALGFRPRRVWNQPRIVDALIVWKQSKGTWPTTEDWRRAGSFHPNTAVVYEWFTGWGEAIKAASGRERELEREGEQVPAGPVQDAIRTWLSEDGNTLQLLSVQSGHDRERLARLLNHQTTVSRRVADEVLVTIGRPDIWHTNDELAGRGA